MPSNHDPTSRLERLLKLKRHEAASEAELERNASRIMAHLEGERARPRFPWWSPLRALTLPRLRPALACAYSLAVLALLVLGINMSELSREDESGFPPPINISAPPDPEQGTAVALPEHPHPRQIRSNILERPQWDPSREWPHPVNGPNSPIHPVNFKQ